MARFSLENFISFDYNEILNSADFVKIAKSLQKIPYTEVENIEGLMRLDLISRKYYGVFEMWWVLALYNSINKPIQKVKTMKLYIPSLIELEKWYFENREWLLK
jgi:hypothetical protein